jgi:hypothetical protein
MRLPKALTLAVAAGSAAVSADPSLGPGQPCPEHLRSTVTDAPDEPFKSLAEVHRALSICPSVQSVQLRLGGFGCMGPEIWWLPIHPDAATSDRHRYKSAPEVLELETYAWGSNARRSIGEYLDEGILPGFLIGRKHPNGEYRTLGDWLAAWRWRFKYWTEWRRLSGLSESQLRIDNIALLLGALNTSRIHTLGIKSLLSSKGDRPDLTRLARALPNLETLTIWGDLSTCRRDVWAYPDPSDDGSSPDEDLDNNCNPVPSFIHSLRSSSLTNLTWLNGNDTSRETLTTVLDRHGSSLEHLQWRTDETFTTYRTFFSPSSLRTIGERVPGLTSLTVDLDRNGTAWPTAHLKAIAESMPNLTSLTIYIPLSNIPEETDPWSYYNVDNDRWGPDNSPESTLMGEDREQDVWAANTHENSPPPRQDYQLYGDQQRPHRKTPKYAAPVLLTESAAELYETLKAAKKGTPLETVQFRVGDWSRSYTRKLGDGRYWLDGRRAWFRCSTLRDDGTPKDEGDPPCDARRMTRMPDRVHGLAEWADISGGFIVSSPYGGGRWNGDEDARDGKGDVCHDPNWDSWW